MKRILALILTICLLGCMGGCAKKEEMANTTGPTVLVAYAAYRYEEGYQLSEGWMYDMIISSQTQMKELEGLTQSLKLTVRDEMFDHGRGYYLVFRDADGSARNQMLILENGSVSRDGLMYEAENAGALLGWLDALEIEEQDIE